MVDGPVPEGGALGGMAQVGTGPAGVRVALLSPTLARGHYWFAVLHRLARIYARPRVFTGYWPGFTRATEGAFDVEVVGRTRFIRTSPTATGYSNGFIYASPRVVPRLLRYRPHVVFTSAFSLWTLLTVALKPLGGWRIIVTWDGSSPRVDARNSRLRMIFRRFMARYVDAFVTNTEAGRSYLTGTLGAAPRRVFARPYQVADPETLLARPMEVVGDVAPGTSPGDPPAAHPDPEAAQPRGAAVPADYDDLPRPIFLFVGRIIQGKGLHTLIEASARLAAEGRTFSLVIIGSGPERPALQRLAEEKGLADRIRWIDWVDYGWLGEHFRAADVFVFPSFEDVWGMVVLEAMTFGKPVICSRWAGAAELVEDDVNGYVVDPRDPESLKAAMARMVDDAERIRAMGEAARRTMEPHTPDHAAAFLRDVAVFTLTGSRSGTLTALHPEPDG